MDISTSTAPIAAEPPPGFAPLCTERLSLRPYAPDDAAALHRLINDWEIARTLSGVPYPYPRDLADAWIASTAREREAGRAWHLAVTAAAGGALMGGVGLRLDPSGRAGLLGYWIGRKAWRQGYATEAAGRLAHWALANLDLDRLEAVSAADNLASIAVLRRLGFRPTGTGAEHFVARGAACPIERFAVTRADLAPGGTMNQTVPLHTAPPAKPGAASDRPLLLVAACALIDADGRVLLARRPEGKALAGLWEFPGGKMAPTETPEQTVIRELAEELGIDISAACLAPFAFASHAYERFHLLMPLFLCRRWTGIPVGLEGQALAWVAPAKLASYPMPEADKPLIPLLRDFL